MNKTEQKKKRARYQVAVNLTFVLRLLWQWDRLSLLLFAANLPGNAVMRTLTLLVPAALIRDIEQGYAPAMLLAIAAGFTAALILLNVVSNRLQLASFVKQTEITRRMDVLFSEKVMDMDFELAEGPRGRTLYQKAKNALEYDGAYGFLGIVVDLLRNLLGFFSFAAIIATLHPLIVVALIAAQGLALLADVWQHNDEQSFKETRAAADRKINYITKSAKDFGIAKDIRLYSLAELLRALGELFVAQKKRWETRLYYSYLIADTVRLVLKALITAGVYGYIIYRLTSGDMPASQIVLYLGAVLGFTGWLTQISQNVDDIGSASLKLGDVREFLALENQMNCGAGAALPQNQPSSLELQGVQLCYPGAEKAALDGIDLTIHPGERLAIVGVNGAGKTTLVKLLCGLYRPTKGTIRMGGTDIAQFNRDAYYTQFAVVFQDIRVMPLCVAANISMQTPEETDYALAEECLKQAGLWERVQQLPEGMETLLVKNVNEGGVELSGGEMQKLMLARAIYKAAPFVILDEPTAALDPIAEQEMYLRYHELTQGKTSVYISHRLSSTRFCDRIVFLDGAHILEQGTHEELLRLGGKYAEMFAVQSRYYREHPDAVEPENAPDQDMKREGEAV